MADNETSYLPIGTCLEQIEKAVYGREVRKAIHDGIAQCYDDTVEGVNAAQQAASDTRDVIDNAVAATNRANTAVTEASNVKVEQTVSGDTVTFTTTKRDGTTVSTSFQKPNIVVSKDEGSGEFSVTGVGWNGEEIVAKIPDSSEEVKSRATIAAVSKVKTALGNPLTITDGMDAPAVKTVVTLEPKQDLHGYDHPWVGGSGKNLIPSVIANSTRSGITYTRNDDGTIVLNGTATGMIDFYPAHESGVAVGKSGGFVVPAGTYSFGSVTGGSSTTYRAYLVKWIGSETTATYNSSANGEGTVTLSEEATIDFFVRVDSGVTLNNLVISPMVRLSSTESGYAPYSNICPIEGYDTVRVTATGKNLYTGALKILSHSIDASGTYNYDPAGCVTEYIPVKGADAIKWGVEVYPSARGRRLHAYDQYGNWLRQLDFFSSANDGNRLRTVTLTEDVAYVRLSVHVDDVRIFIYTDQSITGFIKDEGSTTSLSVAQAAGATVYGGTVTLNEDGSGTLVVDRASVTLSGLDTNKVSYSPSTKTFYITPNVAPGLAKKDYTAAFTGICDKFEPYPGTPAWSANTKPYIGYGSDLNFRFAIPGKTEVADVLDILNGTTVTYYLATPATYTLTASQLRTLTGENHVWTDGTKLELTYRADKYADVEKFLNAIPTGTKTGNPAVFADGADDLPFEKLTIAVEPHQEGSGDPSPDNVRPITGWDEVKVMRAGKNKFQTDDYSANGITINYTNNGCIINGTATTNVIHIVTLNNPLTAGNYTLSASNPVANSNILLRASTSAGSAIELPLDSINKSATFTANGKIVTVTIRVASGTTLSNFVVHPQLELGSTATSYEHYTVPTTLPISLKYATGSTVYGGTVTINRDGTGSVVVDRAKVDMGTLTWTYQTSATIQLFRASVTGIKTGGSDMAKLSCPIYKWVPTSQRTNNTISQNYSTNVDVMDSRYTDAASFKAAMSGIPLIYELATPTTYTLTAPQLTSLLGNNTVWCDAGQVTVKYKRDIAKAITTIEASLISAGLWEGSAVVAPGA